MLYAGAHDREPQQRRSLQSSRRWEPSGDGPPEVLLGGARHLDLVPTVNEQVRRPWPHAMVGVADVLTEHADRRVVALASGDPLVAGVGTTLIDLLGAERVTVLPALSSVALARGVVAASDGDDAGARRDLEDAIDLFGRSRIPFETACARLELAPVLARLGRPDLAVREGRRAYESLAALGAQPAANRAAELVASLATSPQPRRGRREPVFPRHSTLDPRSRVHTSSLISSAPGDGSTTLSTGASGAIAGLGTGEMFGFHFDEIAFLAPIFEPLHGWVGVLSVSELTFDQVVKILKVSIAIGIVHLLMAFFLRLRANMKQGNKLMIYTHDIPTIIQYLAVVALILAAIGSGYDIIGMFGVTGKTHTEPVPWLTFVFGDWVTVDLVAKAAPPVIIATVVIMIIGGIKEEKHMKAHGKDEGGGLVGIVVEVIMVRIIEMLSNTISYSRIGIMLLVHSALLVTVNQSFEHGGGYAVLIGGNIGIMLIEGLIVYIQTIRLHLYEWFPKWYAGEGVEFKKIVPKMLYSNFVWKGSEVPVQQAKK